MNYLRRAVDEQLDWLLHEAKAVAIDGPKAVGKTATALQRAQTSWYLDDPAYQQLARSSANFAEVPKRPLLLDEWQHVPEVWDKVRRQVDAGAAPGSFLLTGSASPVEPRGTHSGAGRIFSVRMRPMALHERGETAPSVSFAELLRGDFSGVTGSCEMTAADYLGAAIAGGFPDLRGASDRLRGEFLDSYIERVLDRDLPEVGLDVRSPETLRRWLAAYAAATSTTTSYSNMLDATTGGDGAQPAKTTTIRYRDFLTKIWLLDEVPPYLPAGGELKRLGQSPKHQLADPALAARLLGITLPTLLSGRNVQMAGPLFEALVTLSVRVLAQSVQARVQHLRTAGGAQEVDLVCTGEHGEVLAIEVKLARHVDDADVRHLLWLRKKLAGQQVACVVVCTGPVAYVREDGVAVVPLGMLGA